MFHRLLRHVRQRRIGAAEGHYRQLGEKQPDGGEGALTIGPGQRHRGQPQQQPQQGRAQGVASLGCRRRYRAALPAQPAGQPGGQHDQRKGYAKCEDSQERNQGQPARPSVQKRPFADTQTRLHHHRQHRWLQAQEQALDHLHMGEAGIKRRQGQHDQEAGQHEQNARRQPTPGAVQQPAGIGGQLLRFRPRQQHAEIKGMKKTRLVQPAFFIHQNAMHGGDLTGGTAERQQADAQKGAQGFRVAWIHPPKVASAPDEGQ